MHGLTGSNDHPSRIAVEGGIEIQHDIVLVNERRDQLVAQTQIQGEIPSGLPVILEEVALLPVVNIHRRSRLWNECDGGCWEPQQPIGKCTGASANAGGGDPISLTGGRVSVLH